MTHGLALNSRVRYISWLELGSDVDHLVMQTGPSAMQATREYLLSCLAAEPVEILEKKFYQDNSL